MARESDQLARQVESLRQVPVGRIEAGAADVLLAHALRRPAPGGRGEGADGVLAQPERLADIADGGARAVGDDGRGDTGAIAGVLLVDVLHHDLAPLVLE